MSVKIKRKQKVNTAIPTASMPDIIFMLLLFFMVATTMKQFEGLKVELPGAKRVDKMESKRHQTTIWIDRQNNVVMDDFAVPSEEITKLRNMVYQKLADDPRLVVVFQVDQKSEMGRLIDVQHEVRTAFVNGARVIYSAIPL